MGAAFTPEERDRIADALLRTAAEQFSMHGVRKTSLEDLVASVGIAKGSFYAFFDSKEDLYVELMIRRIPLVTARLLPALDRPADEDGLVEVMRIITGILTEDPLYRRLALHPEELEAVSRRIGPERTSRIMPDLLAPLHAFLRRGQESGALVDDIDAADLVHVVRVAGLIVTNRRQFGDALDAALTATITTLARGMRR